VVITEALAAVLAAQHKSPALSIDDMHEEVTCDWASVTFAVAPVTPEGQARILSTFL
jgi:hypothetical protein